LGSLIICHPLVSGSAKTEKKTDSHLKGSSLPDNKGTEDNLNKFTFAIKEVRDLIHIDKWGALKTKL